MPPDVPIAGGANLSGVRDHVRWATTLSASPTTSISSVDTDTDSDDAGDSASDLEDVTSSTSSSYTDAIAFPPSPPVHPLTIVAKKLPSQADYFSTRKATFLTDLFPHDKQYTKAISVHLENQQDWNLALLEDTAGRRVLYAQGHFAQVNMRENLVELLDVADEELECDSLVVVLDKTDDRFATTLHSLMYVGGAVIAQDIISKAQQSHHILVGIDLA